MKLNDIKIHCICDATPGHVPQWLNMKLHFTLQLRRPRKLPTDLQAMLVAIAEMNFLITHSPIGNFDLST
jgi:hypothetical protein